MGPRLPARCWRQLGLQLSPPSSAPPLLAGRTATLFPSHSSNLSPAAPHALSSPLLPLTARRGMKTGWSTLPTRARPRRFNQPSAGLPLLLKGPAAALKRRENTTPVRTGVLAVKKGMTAFYGRTGSRIPCTVLQMDRVQVVANKTRAANGYWAVQMGMGERRADNVGAPLLGYYEAKGIAPKQELAEFKVRNGDGLMPVGVQLFPDWFYVGQLVDVRSTTKGKGFAGVMKRHGFHGQPASHGNSKNHRTMGSAGQSQGGGSRVYPGKRMAGNMGNERHTVQNLPILLINNELGLVVVKGAVAGPKKGVVRIQDAVKRPPPKPQFLELTRQLLQERFPDAGEKLAAARARHMELKEARRQGRIDELLVSGVKEEDLYEPGRIGLKADGVYRTPGEGSSRASPSPRAEDALETPVDKLGAHLEGARMIPPPSAGQATGGASATVEA